MFLHRCVFTLCIFVGASLSVFGETIIVESQPEGQNNDHYKEILGKWISSHNPVHSTKSRAPGLTDPQKCGSRKILFKPTQANATGTSAPAAARFMPKISAPGHYYVYVTWPESANAQPVYYHIRHAKGTTVETLVQTGNGGPVPANSNEWVSLGEYDFNPGDEQYVEMRVDSDTKALHNVWSGQAFADAMLFSSQPQTKPAKATPAPKKTTYAAAVTPAPTSTAPVPDPVWLSDIRQAITVAGQSNRRILLFFYSPLSTTCQYYEKEVFTRPDVKSLINSGYVPVRVDFATQCQVAAALNVFRAGTLCLYDSAGNSLAQMADRMSASEIVSRLR